MPNSRRYSAATPFLPNSIPGLTLWLDYLSPDTLFTDTAMTTRATVGQTVKGWADRSGNGYHATEATNPPTLAADGLVFDGTNDVLRVARMTGQFGAGFSYFMVASVADGRPAAVSNIFGARMLSPTRDYFFLRVDTGGNLTQAVNENSVQKAFTYTTLADGAISAFIATATADPAGNMAGYLNGVAAGTPVSLTPLTWGNIAGVNTETVYLGAMNQDGTALSHCACTIKSLIIWNRPLTATELSQVHRYIGNLHGIIVP